MRWMTRFLVPLLMVLPVLGHSAEWSEAQRSLWQFVEQSWVDDVGKTGKWPASYVHEDVLTWGAEWPVPRGRESMAKWTGFRDTRSEVLEYELFPHALIVEGNTGVAFYSVVEVRKLGDGEVERTVNGLVETAVREGRSWKYIGLSGFEMGGDDDD